MLGVSAKTLLRYGAVSRETVIEMARGALDRSGAQLSVAVSGVAGPGGGTPEKPVGTVWIAWATEDLVDAVWSRFAGDRAAVRSATIDAALVGLREHAR
jgi:nicotinamide-nucleotide amidase